MKGLTQVLILVGGKGERLQPLTDTTPKPMALVSEKPFLEYQIGYLKKFSFKNIILATGYLAKQFEKYFASGKKLGVKIIYSHETRPLGTAGAIKNAEKLIKSDKFLVLNGDSFLKLDYNKFIKSHNQYHGLGSIALSRVGDISRYGEVKLDSTNKIISFAEKTEAKKAGWINGGVYYLKKNILDFIPKNKKVSIEKQIFPKLVGKIYGYKTYGYFMDIGTPKDYNQLRKEVKRIFL